ncbi:urease accessory protein UreF [Actinomadura yumaensis]|uniref:Urease accessory protein UreF n=1 Tax=Actinomadura yumaensis TaxID=111807 RepID=A0ABW2CKH6_9ACTN
MNASLLLLADSRLPAGGHAHSGGLEPAVAAGAVTDVDELADFLRGRLATAGLVAAALAAAACAALADRTEGGPGWAGLDREADARTPSPAQRRASRAQGRSLLRVARAAWPHSSLDALGSAAPDGPHHPLVLGAAPASAAVRLLGLDPLAVNRALAALAPRVDAVAAEAAGCARGPWSGLPAPSAPLLDLHAENHLRSDLRLFES